MFSARISVAQIFMGVKKFSTALVLKKYNVLFTSITLFPYVFSLSVLLHKCKRVKQSFTSQRTFSTFENFGQL